MEIAINTFTKGMDQDTDISLLEKSKYIEAYNIRITADPSGSNGVIGNLKGTNLLRSWSSDKIIGYTVMKDDLIVFTTQSSDATKDRIWKISFDKTVDGTVIDGTPEILVENTFGFDDEYSIEAVSRYENQYLQKIYWTDGLNNIRFANIAPTLIDGSTNDLSALSLSDFELVPDAQFGRITLDSISGGSLPIGVVQYAYQYFTQNGTESVISPESRLYHITTNSETLTTPLQYAGSAPDENDGNSGKSYKVNLEDVDQSFDNIRTYGIYYTSLGQVPVIKMIGESAFDGATYSFIDTGSDYLAEITLEEFAILGGTLFKASHLEEKDNYLFAANIEEQSFVMPDEAFDARAYRFDSGRESKIYDSTGTLEDTIDGISPTYPTDLTLDAINKFNDIDNDSDTAQRYCYKADGVTYGGQGPNISYEFGVQAVQNNDVNTHSWEVSRNVDDTTTFKIDGYNSYGNPKYSNMKSYHRDEIYRFGIVFYDTLGRESSAQWINDIRMPHISDFEGGSANFNTVDENGFIQSLYVKFNVSLADMFTNHPDTFALIQGYRIVRVPREENDKTILAQGLSSPMFYTYYSAVVDTEINNESTWFPSRYARVTNASLTVSGEVTIDGYRNVWRSDELEFISPDPLINKNLYSSTSDRVNLCGFLYKGPKDIRETGVADNTIKLVDQAVNVFTKIVPYTKKVGDPYLKIPDVEVTDSELVGVKSHLDSFTAAGLSNMRNIALDTFSGNSSYSEDGRLIGVGGSFTAIKTNGSLDLADTDEATDIAQKSNIYSLINYKRKNILYGGDSYENRRYNKYIGDTSIINKNISVVYATNGDTFISYFDYLRTFYNNDGDDGVGSLIQAGLQSPFVQALAIPLESRINSCLRHDKNTLSYLDTGAYSNRTWGYNGIKYTENGTFYNQLLHDDAIQNSSGLVLMRETKADGIAKWGDDYPDEFTDLYQYNTVYSTDTTIKYFYPKQSDLIDKVESNTRIQVADIKVNGESSDSWTKFKVNNFLEVDAKYGAITRLLSHQDHLYFFQEDGIGVLPTNQRELIETGNPGALQLGTGSVLSRYDYVTTTSGTRHTNSVVSTPFGIFYYDASQHKIFNLSQGEVPISIIKGMHSFLTREMGNDILYNDDIFNKKGVIVGYDAINNELLFTFMTSALRITLAYDLIKQVFSTFVNISPWLYIEYNNKLFSNTSSSSGTPNYNQLHVHNEGDYGKLHNILYDSKIKFVVNDNYSYTKVFDNMTFDTRVTNSSGVDQNETFDTVDINTSYQDTGVINLTVDSNILRRDRNWNIAIPRDESSTNRLRDKYATIELVYNNTNNNKLTLPYLSTRYRVNYR